MARSRALVGLLVAVGGCTTAADFGMYHALGGDLSATAGDDLAGPRDGGAPGDAGCGAVGAACCAGQCATGCCESNRCLAVGDACKGSSMVCGSTKTCVRCGYPGQPCCGGDACLEGGCCNAASRCVHTGGDVAPGQVCLDGKTVACGGAGMACCGASACGGAGCCSDDHCVMANAPCAGVGLTCDTMNLGGNCGNCGANGLACCTGDPLGGANANFCTGFVNGPLGCDIGSDNCGTCGGTGDPCCDGNVCAKGCCDHGQVNNRWKTRGTCIPDGNQCSDTSVCGFASCGPCGGVGQAECGNGVGCTAPFTVADNVNMCVRCGAVGEPCCAGSAGGYCAQPFACAKNTSRCATCGAVGEPCCRGSTCEVGRVCNNGLCQ